MEEERPEIYQLLIGVLLAAILCLGSVLGSTVTEDRWKKKIIERGYGTYVEGEFKWNDELEKGEKDAESNISPAGN